MLRSLTLLCLPFLFIAACSKPSQQSPGEPIAIQRITSQSVVKVVGQPLEIARGGSADATVRLTIQNGYHVNANPPTYSYLKPTELEVTPGDGFSVNYLTYPTALTKKFPFAEKSLAVYEGNTDLKVSLKANPKASPGEHSIPAVLRVQACDDQVCYPPGQIDLRIPVTIK